MRFNGIWLLRARKQTLTFLISDREVSKASPTSIKVARAPGTGNYPLASNPVPRVQPISPKPLDPALSRAFAKESSLNAAYDEPGSARVCDINYTPPESCIPLQSKHNIGMALTTTQTILNYSNGHGDTHNKVQSKGDKKAARVSIQRYIHLGYTAD